MLNAEFFKHLIYYFIKLPLFSIQLYKAKYSTLEDISYICPTGPKTEFYRSAIMNACRTYTFLKEQDPKRLSVLYNLISTIREADVFTYPFLNKRTVTITNAFHNPETLSESYEKGPVLILYAHTGSYYQVAAASGELGYKIYPIAYGIDLSTMEKPFRWLFWLNMKLSERHFSGGYYLYTDTPSFSPFLKRLLSKRDRAVLYAALDLPRSLMTQKRLEVAFLGGKAAFPDKIIYTFAKLKLPILIAFPWIDVAGNKIKRNISFEKVPDALSPPEIVQFYSSQLENFIRERPEQLMTLVNLGGFFV